MTAAAFSALGADAGKGAATGGSQPAIEDRKWAWELSPQLIAPSDRPEDPYCSVKDFTSTEVEEFPRVCHRVLVFREGRIAGELAGQDATEAGILNLAAGG